MQKPLSPGMKTRSWPGTRLCYRIDAEAGEKLTKSTGRALLDAIASRRTPQTPRHGAAADATSVTAPTWKRQHLDCGTTESVNL